MTSVPEQDDPIAKRFASWRSYQNYAQRVRHSRRYVWTLETHAFLKTVLSTLRDRDVAVPEGSIFHRAQRGIDYQDVTDEDGVTVGEEPLGFGAGRMKPRATQATEGRANAAGIPVLYMATSETTAISEVRPWIGSMISVAQLELLRAVRAVDLSKGHGKHHFLELIFSEVSGKSPDPEKVEQAVWTDIDNAFSEPVTLSDDSADYVPTQILAELFRNEGYEAIIYRSQFGAGFNIALFDTDDARVINCAPYRVTSIDIQHEEIGNRWFVPKPNRS